MAKQSQRHPSERTPRREHRDLAPSFSPGSEGEAFLSPGMVLDLFDEPIMFRRIYVDLTGSVTAALWLSHLVTHHASLNYVDHERQWFERSMEQITEETGLTRFEQETARRRLRDLSILDERRMGMPARLQFLIKHERLASLLREQSDARWKDKLA